MKKRLFVLLIVSVGVALSYNIAQTQWDTPAQYVLGTESVSIFNASLTPTDGQSGTIFIARPLTAKRTATLPGASAGLNYTFMVADADSLLITTASGDSLITSAGAAWKTTTSVAGTIKVIAIDGVRWVMVFTLGTWTSY